MATEVLKDVRSTLKNILFVVKRKMLLIENLSYSEVANSGSLGMVHGTVVCSKLRSINSFVGYTIY